MSSITEGALAAWPLLAMEVLILGTVIFTVWVAPADPGERSHLQRTFAPLWRALSVVTLAFSPLGLLVDTSAMAKVPLSKAFALLPEVMSETHMGRMWAWRLGFAVLLTIATWLSTQRFIGMIAIATVAAALLLLGSFSSHAIDKGLPAVAPYFIHELAASLWIGALVGTWLGFTWTKLGDEWLERAARRVSRTAGYSVAVVILTGIYNAYNSLGLMLDHLLYSAYGRTLLVKVVLFAVVMSIGGFNRYHLVPAIEKGSTRDLLLRNVTVESILLIAILGVAAILSNTPPAHY
jgi:putative copper resistance protein D